MSPDPGRILLADADAFYVAVARLVDPATTDCRASGLPRAYGDGAAAGVALSGLVDADAPAQRSLSPPPGSLDECLPRSYDLMPVDGGA